MKLSRYFYVHFTDELAEAHENEVVCLRSYLGGPRAGHSVSL